MDETLDENADTVTPSSPTARLREFAPHPYQSLNSDGEILTVNEAWLDKLGYDREEVEGKWFGELLTNDSVDKFESRFPEFKSAGSISNVEYEMQSADGDVIAVSFDGTIECDEDGAFVRTHCQFTDISERKQYETFIENSPDIILLHDETGEPKYVSPAVTREMGYDPESLMGRNPFDDVHPDDLDRVKETFSRLLSEPGKVMTEEYRIQDADGSYVWVESRAKNLMNEGGIKGLLFNSRVIQERKEYEQDLEEANDQLRVLNRVLRHDIRNDMNLVLGWGKELEDHVDEDGKQMLTQILDSGQHVVDLTKTLRDFMRVYGEEEAPKLTPIDIGNSLENEIRKIQEQYPSVVVDVSDELPHIKVRANELIATVFWNLLQNAIKHNDKEVPKIEIGVEVNEETVTIQVADNGPGIPEEQRDEIFGRGESGLKDPDAGIGLYLVDTVLTQYGGDVWVEENEPEGAMFVVELPKSESEG